MIKQLFPTLLALLVSFSVVGQTSIYNNRPVVDPIQKTGLTKSGNGQADHAHDHNNSGEKCIQQSVTEALMATDPQYREGVLAAKAETRRIMAELESGVRAAPPVYTIPVVFHVIHKGEAVGSGTNISDAQIQSCIDALNRDYRRTSADGGIAQGAGPDTEIQFCLAGYDPQGNPHSGINRVSGMGVSGYSANGITIIGGGNEQAVKDLSRWDNRYYLNIWVVSEIEGNGADVANPANFFGGTLGFAYQPSSPVTFNSDLDGVVAINVCVGNDPNQTNGYRLWPWGGLTNRTVTHEVGHFLGLDHTFANSFSCSDGDGISDTPPAIQFDPSNCNDDGSCNQQIENYMDYTPEECQDQFTAGQKSAMRGVLAGVRNALVNTSNCSTGGGNNYDAGISGILNPNGALCSTTFTPQVTLTNYGSTTLTSVQIAYAVDAQSQPNYPWSGSLATGASATVTLPSVTTTAGSHSFTANTVSGTLNTSNNDQDTGNDNSSSSFNVGTSGTGVTLTLELDCWGAETTWEITDANNNVVLQGGPYTSSLPNGSGTQVATACLANGCYDFTIYDSNSDGIEGTLYPQSCNVDGDYTIVDDNNATLVNMTAVNFGASATHNFCVGGGGNPGTPSCEILASFDGEVFDINPTDEPNFEAFIIDNDQEPVNSAISGYSSNWMLGWYESTTPGDTNWFIGSTSWHDNETVAADNWLTFGPVTMMDDDGELRWKHMYSDDLYRDGYEVLVGTVGTDVADFAGATQLFSVSDNDASTAGNTSMTQQSVSLPAGTYANQSLYFAFHHNALNMYLMFIDDIEVEGCTSLTVGIDENPEFEMTVFPNPSNHNFTYRFNSNTQENIAFEMFDAVGRSVWTGTDTGNRNGTGTIETNGMATGVYTLIVRGESFNVSERLVLTK
ncbi:MAG: T9SS type A sorting domain-containing protein [Flavobacteriales bacterium]|nr:zinc-dependent metalloprotease [Flavobacteriales bacterium]MCB9192095.1 T9SS type A sorting domain-containing protein [Flavobacteriales bacterium]